MWARAVQQVNGLDTGIYLRTGYPCQTPCKLDQVKGLGILQTVEDIAPLAPSNDNIRLAQGHQMLRDVRLAQAQGGFQMAHTGFTIPDHQQDTQALRLP